MNFLDRKKVGVVALALVVGLLIGSFVTYALLQYSARVSSTATLKAVGVGVYKDVNCTVSLTAINWGMLEPGQSINYSAYVKNLSNVPITLSMYTEGWSPTNATNYISLSWIITGQQLAVGAVAPVTFTLNVSQAIQGIQTFSFTIVIIGSG